MPSLGRSLALVFIFVTYGCMGDFDFDFDFSLSDCSHDGACPAGEVCVSGFLGGACQSRVVCAEDAECEDWRECRVRDEAKRRSNPATPNRTTCEPRLCHYDHQCPDDYVCEEICTPRVTCEADAHCDAGEVCRTRSAGVHVTRRSCEPPRCHADENCPPDEVCLGPSPNWRVCEPGACGSDSDCQPVGYFSTVTECRLRDTSASSVSRTTCEPTACGIDLDCPVDSVCFGRELGCVVMDTCESDEDCEVGPCGATAWKGYFDPETDRRVCEKQDG